MDGTIWYLKQCNLFEHLAEDEARRLERHALLRQFKRRNLIYSPKEPGQSVMVLVSGRVKITNITTDGREAILAFIEEGELFGELALLDDQPRQNHAEAVEDARVLAVPREDLVWLMERRPDIALSITRLIGLRRQRIENRLRNLLFLGSRDRMVRILLELTETHAEWVGACCRIRLALSHQDLASLIGVSRETATITLGQLQSEGLIQIQRRRITILQINRLRAQVEGTDTNGGKRPLPVSPAPH